MTPDPLSVLHLLATDERRGAETFGTVLSRQLAERGWRSQVRAIRSICGPDQHAVPALGRSWRDPRGLAAFVRLARDADVVVAHGSTTLWTAALGSAFGCPPFVYANIGDPVFWSSTPARRLRVTALLRRAAAVAAISPRSAASLHDHLGVPLERIRVIPNGRSASAFSPADTDRKRVLRAGLGLPVDGAVVAYVGALSPEKQPLLALRAVAAVDGAHLVVAGDGPLRREVARAGEQLMPGRAYVLGSVARPQDVLAAADALILTSRSEGVPGVLIEAGLTGLPCVSTDVGYTADVVLDGITGRLVGTDLPADLTAGVVEALERADVWGPAAREHCEQTYGLDAVVERWDALLRDVAARRQVGSWPRGGVQRR